MNTEELKAKIIEANKTYRNGNPIMSDESFDNLCEDYQKLVSEEEYSKFRDSLHEVKGKVKHPYVMGSLDKLKVQEPDTIIKFINEHVKTKLNVSAKVDGISCRLHFENGKLKSASTRGDGTFGEDLTDKISYVKNIKTEISSKDPIDIRGELVILKDDFADMTEFANPRNACAGIMGRKDWIPEQVSKVSFIPYTILGDLYIKAEQFKILEDLGFDVAWHKSFERDYFSKKGLNVVDELFKYATQDLPYEIDGAVISDDSYRNEEKYRPDAQAAVKANSLVAETTLLDVAFDGPSVYGQHIPVAILEPVEIGGAMISRASIHNLDIVAALGLKYGSRVQITKRGDIIPQIEEVLSNPDNVEDIILPEVCNCCGSKLVRDGVNLRCINEDCTDQKIYQVEHFIKKLGVMNASFKTLKNFGIDSIQKMLDFTPNKKYKSELKFADELNEKMFTRSKVDLFCSMTMKDVGSTLQDKIVKHYGWDKIEESTSAEDPAEFFGKMPLPSGIGQITFDKFLACYKKNLELVKLITSDIRYHYTEDKIMTTGTKKNGESVCFTGALNTMGRKEASKLAEEAGYEVKSGVSKGLTYLVTNDIDSNSSKANKAKKYGTQVLSEREFLKLVQKYDIDLNSL